MRKKKTKQPITCPILYRTQMKMVSPANSLLSNISNLNITLGWTPTSIWSSTAANGFPHIRWSLHMQFIMGLRPKRHTMRKKTEKKRGVNTHISVGIFKDSLKACDFY